MKQKKDELVSKKYLDEKLWLMKDDLNKKIEETKQDLETKIDKVDKKLDRTTNYMNIKFNNIEEKLIKLDSIDSRLESIMESLAWLTGEYKKFDEEHTVLSEQNNRTNDTINNHEERISRLEQRVVTP